MCKRDWHPKISCDQVPAEEARQRLAEDKQSEATIATVSKPCPNCGVKIQKEGGCVNMHCEYIVALVITSSGTLTDCSRHQMPIWVLLGLHGHLQQEDWRISPKWM